MKTLQKISSYNKMQAMQLLIASFICMSLLNCKNNNNTGTVKQNYPFTFTGVVQKAGITIYMYGSHTISNRDTMYALQSTDLNLDLYINQKILVKGARVSGYPVDNGPELIDVEAIEKK